jgi:hypothetical protein
MRSSRCLCTPCILGIFILKGASQRGRELLDTETEDAALLEAATKQHSEESDGEH